MFVENKDGRNIHIDDSRAAYRVLAIHGFFGPDDTLHSEGDIIYFDGEPNEELEPLTPVARSRLVAYLECLDQFGREAAAKTGKAFVGRPRSIDGGLALATAIQRTEMGLMGVRKTSSEIERADSEEIGETGTAQKRGRGRPRKDSIALSKVAV
jgi:hypothetical protein